MIRVPAISIWSEVYSAAGDPPPALRFAAGMSAVGFAGAFSPGAPRECPLSTHSAHKRVMTAFEPLRTLASRCWQRPPINHNFGSMDRRCPLGSEKSN